MTVADMNEMNREHRQPIPPRAHYRVRYCAALGCVLVLACLLVGCVSVTEHKTLRSANIPVVKESLTVAAAPIPPKPLYLIWENPFNATIAHVEGTPKLPPQWTTIAVVTNQSYYQIPSGLEQYYYRVYYRYKEIAPGWWTTLE